MKGSHGERKTVALPALETRMNSSELKALQFATCAQPMMPTCAMSRRLNIRQRARLSYAVQDRAKTARAWCSSGYAGIEFPERSGGKLQ